MKVRTPQAYLLVLWKTEAGKKIPTATQVFPGVRDRESRLQLLRLKVPTEVVLAELRKFLFQWKKYTNYTCAVKVSQVLG